MIVSGKARKMLALLGMILLWAVAAGAAAGEGLAETILSSMTTEEKIAQLLMPAFYQYTDAGGKKADRTEVTPDMQALLEKYPFGGVVFGIQNNRNSGDAVRFLDQVQVSMNSLGGRCQALTFLDQEGGYVTRLARGTQMPGNMALAAARDLAMTEEAAALIGGEVRRIGYSGVLAPVVDVNNEPANPVINVRSFSDDPEIVSEQAQAFIRGLHSAGSLATLKHFPGHGDTSVDSHYGVPCLDKSYEELKALELRPFQAGIDAGADLVMTAHIQFPRIEKGTYLSPVTGEEVLLPATLSRVFLTDILRGDMGFEGLVITDAMNMDFIRSHFDPLDAARLAIEAGVDLILRPVDTSTRDGLEALDLYVRQVAAMAGEGRLSMEAVNTAVLRVLSFKEKHGLLTAWVSGNVEERAAAAETEVGSAGHHETEFAMAKRAVTMVRNDGVWPVKAGESMVILVPYETEILTGEYTVNRLKEEGLLPRDTQIPVRYLLNLSPREMEEICRETQHIIAVSVVYRLSELNASSPEGVRTACLDRVIALAHACGRDVTVISGHLPYDLARFQAADALVACYGARGMPEDPARVSPVQQYGPNLPAALYLLLSGGEMKGVLPVNIPAMNGTALSDTVLYPRVYSLP